MISLGRARRAAASANGWRGATGRGSGYSRLVNAAPASRAMLNSGVG